MVIYKRDEIISIQKVHRELMGCTKSFALKCYVLFDAHAVFFALHQELHIPLHFFRNYKIFENTFQIYTFS